MGRSYWIVLGNPFVWTPSTEGRGWVGAAHPLPLEMTSICRGRWGGDPIQMDFQRWLTLSLDPRNGRQMRQTPFFLLPRVHCLLRGAPPQKSKKKEIRGGKVLNLISFKLEALRGKLILISHHFQRQITPSPTPGNVFLTAKRRVWKCRFTRPYRPFS